MKFNNISLCDLDCIYLSYDEPQKEEFWLKIRNQIPWCKRVDGVKGSDSAHKKCAEISETERFVIIDGDNIPINEFIDQVLILDDTTKNIQFRWKAKNNINGIRYGNGGISCWTRAHVLNMRTHENTDGLDSTKIEFCFDKNYWPMHDCYSITYPHYSPKQAWRAGFREGVKLCTRNGSKITNIENFNKLVWHKNILNLNIWHTIGRDVINGFYAILGSRLGTHYLMLRDWNYESVQDFDELDKLWEFHKTDDEHICKVIATELNKTLNINICEFDSEQSAFFKKHYNTTWKNIGIMCRDNQMI